MDGPAPLEDTEGRLRTWPVGAVEVAHTDSGHVDHGFAEMPPKLESLIGACGKLGGIEGAACVLRLP